MSGKNNERRCIRFPNLLRIRLVAFFRRRSPKQEVSSDCDASAFFEGCMKYDEVVSTAPPDVLNNSFVPSESCPTPVPLSSSDSGSDESSDEKRRIACCVDDYMMLDDHSLDQLSTFLVSSQQSSIVDNNNIGNIYTIIEELVAEQKNGLKFNPLVDPSKKGHPRDNGVSFSMNSSVFSGKNSGIFSTATPFCIFKDDTSILTSKHTAQHRASEFSATLPNKCDGPTSKLRSNASSSADLWSVNWTEMVDDSDSSIRQDNKDGMLSGSSVEWVLQRDRSDLEALRLRDDQSPEMGDDEPKSQPIDSA